MLHLRYADLLSKVAKGSFQFANLEIYELVFIVENNQSSW